MSTTSKERPILFSAPMVRAILAAQKMQTRRAIKPQPAGRLLSLIERPLTHLKNALGLRAWFSAGPGEWTSQEINSPYGQPGDRLWVRETWRGIVEISPPDAVKPEYGVARYVPAQEHCKRVEYAATGQRDADPWRPSIHMPRWASRILLEVAGVRVERLQDISEADALAEGIVALPGGGFGLPGGTFYHAADPRQSFFMLWESINGPESVKANPWVWVVEFRRMP